MNTDKKMATLSRKLPEEGATRARAGPWFLMLTTLLALASGLYLLLYLHAKTMSRAYRLGAYNAIQRAFQHYSTTGTITNFHELATVFIFTNHFVIKGRDYQCVLGMWWGWPTNKERDLIAITTEGVTLWFETTNKPKILRF